MKRLSFQILILSTLTFVGCTENKKTEETSNKLEQADSVKAEDFEVFNVKFHSDKNFQLSRINFPLKGELMTSDLQVKTWTKQNWQYIDRKVEENLSDKDLKHELTKTDKLIKEKIWMENAGFAIEREFKLIDNKWFLILYKETSV